jgi:hypothetical protein
MVERRSRKGAQATVPAPTAIPKRKKTVVPSSEKSRHHEAENRSDNVSGVGNSQRMQTPESTTRKLRSSALKADPVDEKDTPSSYQRNIQIATTESFTSNTPDTPRGGHPDGQDFEIPEEGLQAVLSPPGAAGGSGSTTPQARTGCVMIGTAMV